MSTATMEAPVNGASATKTAMREVLDERAAQRGLGDRIRSLPATARSYVGQVFRWLHLEGLAGRGKSAWKRASGPLGRVLGPIKVMGWFNLLGAALTCQKGRQMVRKGAGFTARVATWPVRMIGRGLGWIARRIGLSGVADTVEYHYGRGTAWIANKFNDALGWLDAHEHHGLMQWSRTGFQNRPLSRLNRAYLPGKLHNVVDLGLAFVPNFGVGQDGGAENRITLVRDTFREGGVFDDFEADTPATGHIVVERINARLVANGKKVRLMKITSPGGEVLYKLNGVTYTGEQIDELAVFTTEMADTSPMPPMNRAATRAGAGDIVSAASPPATA